MRGYIETEEQVQVAAIRHREEGHEVLAKVAKVDD